MILSLFLLIALLRIWVVNAKLEAANKTLKDKIGALEDAESEVAKLLELEEQVKELEEEVKALVAAQPIIIDAQSDDFNFEARSAKLNRKLKEYLAQKVVPKIETIVKEKPLDFVSVVGHTDGQNVTNPDSNLDEMLLEVANGEESVTILTPGSNADLGLMRALAVVQYLQQTGRFKGVKFRAYSAAQLYLPSGELADPDSPPDNASRRRIEIRFIPPGVKE